jgi:hypothetical protein
LKLGVIGIPLGAFQIAAADVASLGYGVNDVSIGWATGVGADFDGHVSLVSLLFQFRRAAAARD